MGAIDLQPGTVITRQDRSDRWGGSIQGGILPSSSTPNVFVYSDPAEGRKWGYDFDGWSTDGSVFFYTGEGAEGDQTFAYWKNQAVLAHNEQGRTLHLFIAASGRQRGGKLHRYVGEFEVDPALPHVRADDPVRERSVIVFRLRPLGAVDRAEPDVAGFPDVEQTAESSVVPTESADAGSFVRAPSKGGLALRRETNLSKRYEKHLVDQGHIVGRCRVRPPGEIGYLFTDLYDSTADELYEAKAVSTRDAIRCAIGQLFDYRRHIESKDARLTVLLPVRPASDLVDLIHSCGMNCVYETEKGFFKRIDPPS
ncbi:restriction endonuclease [Plantactinospora soyae]|uniref:5-methylcytosine-specific restriction protein A n=1 Tax=Plantactinospora soyae TaxID=1544732 RepID=A0A927QW75_9ACTN|nr:restriction endonuclease [Plantactinospora soyae]MBE1485207.1 5-methylcytosine-specific restriction protein A [Plantactinospora soyae]